MPTKITIPVLLVLLLSSLACSFTAMDSTSATASPTRESDLIPASPGQASDSTPTAPYCRNLLPGETNPDITQWNEPHIVCTPGETNARGELFIFLPGTGATPEYYTHLMDAAAEAGMHVIALRYPNDRSANIQICPHDPDDDCHEKVRREITRGVDVSDNVSVNAENSVEGRLQSALTHLAAQAPDEGWGEYLYGDSILWESIVLSGHSQGGGHAAYIAYQHRVHHIVAFAWVDVRKGELAPWLLDTAPQTPADSWFLFWHKQDTIVARHQTTLMTALGMDNFGAPVVVDDSTPPYSNSHALIATHPAPDGELAHNTYVVDKALVFDQDGEPIYKTAWQYLLTLETPSTTAASASLPGAVNAFKMGTSPLGYIDPEFNSALNLVTFADANMHAWLASLDPQTGSFVSPDGRDVLLDINLTPLRISFNAPEFGVDQNGWGLYYTKDVNGIPQIFRATVNGESVTAQNLTDDSIARLSVLATKNPLLEDTRLLYAYNGFLPGEGSIGWLDETAPQASETIVSEIDRGARWIDNTAAFTFISHGQAAVYDTETQTAQSITNTTGEKSYAYGWLAPETGGMMLLTIVDQSRLEIYTDNGSPYWDLTSTLTVPATSAYQIPGSPEPFIADGKSYISLVVKAGTGYAPAEVWVWGIESADRFSLKCEDALGNVIRTDPETYPGTDQVFVYYNTIDHGHRFDLYRCETGLKP